MGGLSLNNLLYLDFHVKFHVKNVSLISFWLLEIYFIADVCTLTTCFFPLI